MNRKKFIISCLVGVAVTFVPKDLVEALYNPIKPLPSLPLLKKLSAEQILSGLDDPLCLAESIRKNGYFTWSNATRNGERKPLGPEIVKGIIRGANLLEYSLKKLNIDPKDVIITSWYRRPQDNHGVANSKHLEGYAIDFVVEGIPNSNLYKKLEPIVTEYTCNKGGLILYNDFIHLDDRREFKWRHPQ